MSQFDFEALETAVEEAQAAMEQAQEDYANDPTDENFDASAATSRAFQQARKALKTAEDSANTANVAHLSGIGKEAKSLEFRAGSTVAEVVAAAGWRTDRVTYAIVTNGVATKIGGDDLMPSGSVNLQVQANTNAG